MFATFLALGEFTNFLRLGFLRYWQRQGFCSLILLQQTVDGALADVIALTQGLSCVGLHVTAIVTSAFARSSTSRAHTAMYDEAFIFHSLKICLCMCERERGRDTEKDGRVCGGFGWGSLSIYRGEMSEKKREKE